MTKDFKKDISVFDSLSHAATMRYRREYEISLERRKLLDEIDRVNFKELCDELTRIRNQFNDFD